MKAERIELAALASAAGPQRTPQEIETYAMLAEMDAITKRLNAMTPEQRQERSHAVLSQCVRASDAEAVRAAFWMRAPLPARMVAVMSVRLPKERAHNALSTFDALERGLIWVALDRLIGDLQDLKKCMNGGRMPARTEGVH
jgi:hypothetical protein